jgi:large subunit ribosomal protein L16
MLTQPRNRKFKKDQRNFKSEKSLSRAHRLIFGSYGLKSLESNHLTANQLESVRRTISRRVKKIAKIWIRCFPWKPISGKPTKTRMGKGKGSVQYWVSPIQPGQVIIELSGQISEKVAKDILTLASHKLPVTTKFVSYNSCSI